MLYFFLARAWLRDRELRLTAIARLHRRRHRSSACWQSGRCRPGKGWSRSRGCGGRSAPTSTRMRWPSTSLRAAGFALGLARSSRRCRAARRWLLGGATAVLLLALVLTFSRGALLGLGFGARAARPCRAYLYRPARRRRHARASSKLRLVLLAAVAGCTPSRRCWSASSPPTGAINLRGGDSLGLREMIWHSALAMIRDHPAFGVGLDQFVLSICPALHQPGGLGRALHLPSAQPLSRLLGPPGYNGTRLDRLDAGQPCARRSLAGWRQVDRRCAATPHARRRVAGRGGG